MIKKEYIGLIPARIGSQELKKKNLRKIAGRTLLEIAIDNLKKTKIVKKVYVSSDSSEILKIAMLKGANIIKRPKIFSKNSSTANQVVKHFFSKINVKKNSYLIYLQPSSPLKNSKHLINAIKLIKKRKNKSLISCYKKNFEKFFKSFVLNKKLLKPLFNQNVALSNRQRLKELFIPNGAFYIIKISNKVKTKGINFDDCMPYSMKEKEVIDINTKKDLNFAKANFKKNNISAL